MSLLYTIGISILYLVLSLVGMTLIKLGHADLRGITIPFLGVISTKLILGVVLYGLAFLVFTFFISKLEISVAIPIVSGIYCAFTVIIGMLIFGEKTTIGQIVGIFFVVTGIVLIGLYNK